MAFKVFDQYMDYDFANLCYNLTDSWTPPLWNYLPGGRELPVTKNLNIIVDVRLIMQNILIDVNIEVYNIVEAFRFHNVFFTFTVDALMTKGKYRRDSCMK